MHTNSTPAAAFPIPAGASRRCFAIQHPDETARLRYREATSADVPAIHRSRASDLAAGPADERMAAYLDGRHHPQQALAPRTAFWFESHGIRHVCVNADLDSPDAVPFYEAHHAQRLNKHWFIWEDIRVILDEPSTPP